MLYEYNTEYSAACYHEDLNSKGNMWLRFNMSIVYQLSVAERLRRWLHNLKVVSSSPAVDKKNFSFCKPRVRSLQLEEAHANEINHFIHLANTLFQIKVRRKKYCCRLQRYITGHVSFNDLCFDSN